MIIIMVGIFFVMFGLWAVVVATIFGIRENDISSVPVVILGMILILLGLMPLFGMVTI